MNKIVFTLLAIIMVGSLIGCGTSDSTNMNEPKNEKMNWPKETITLYVPAKAGGGTDIVARLVASHLQDSLGVNVTVVNQDAGSGMVAYESVRKAAPDGNTILFWHNGIYVNYYSGVYDYNPNKDFTPISVMEGDEVQVFIVNGDSPWGNIDDLVQDARKRPDEYTYGVQVGGSAQLVAEILQMEADIDLRLVDAASQTDKITGVMGGNIDISAVTLQSAIQYVETGDIKIIGVVDPKPDSNFPEYESAIEQGYKDLHWSTSLAIYGPTGMDEDLAEKINEAILEISNNEKVLEQMKSANILYLPENYEDSQRSFKTFDETVKKVSQEVDWGN